MNQHQLYSCVRKEEKWIRIRREVLTAKIIALARNVENLQWVNHEGPPMTAAGMSAAT